MPSQLSIYLRNHDAAARAGYDLLRRAARNQRRRRYADVLRQIQTESREDLRTLRQLMRRLNVAPAPLLATVLRLGERVGRLKPNGRVFRRAQLSDLVEIEGVLASLQVKATGYRALSAAQLSQRGGVDLDALIRRADSQYDRLRAVHYEVASTSLSD